LQQVHTSGQKGRGGGDGAMKYAVE
jgi:hypothetical protein